MTRLSVFFISLLTTLDAFAAVTPRQGSSGLGECLVESANDLDVDDSGVILDTFKRCSSNSVIRFSPTNYTVYTPISLTDLRECLASF